MPSYPRLCLEVSTLAIDTALSHSLALSFSRERALSRSLAVSLSRSLAFSLSRSLAFSLSLVVGAHTHSPNTRQLALVDVRLLERRVAHHVAALDQPLDRALAVAPLH